MSEHAYQLRRSSNALREYGISVDKTDLKRGRVANFPPWSSSFSVLKFASNSNIGISWATVPDNSLRLSVNSERKEEHSCRIGCVRERERESVCVRE